MLVLSRKKSEAIMIINSITQSPGIKIVILEISKGMVKLGIEAPLSVAVHRTEVWERQQDKLTAMNAF